MSSEFGSMRPNPYIFDIENRKKRKPRLAHDLGAGAKCNKCGDKCPGFELHFWRKICMNCRCSKDDHEVEDDEEDIGQIVIGKLFDRPARTEREELEYCYGNSLEIVNEETGKAENVKFDWVPPNVEKTLASRYMELLPPDKRPIAGTEAAKARRRQLEQQVPLYDMDAAQRSDSLPPEELQNFLAYLERIRTQVAGQGSVQEILGAPAPSYAKPLHWQASPESTLAQPGGESLDANGNIGYPPNDQSQIGMPGQGAINQANILNNNNNNNRGIDESTQATDNIVPADPRRPSTQMPSLRQQFLGGMVGEPVGLGTFKAEDPTHSTPYGGTRMTSRPLYGSGSDNSLGGISTGLSDLNLQDNLPGQRSTVPNLPQVPYSGAPKGYRPVRPPHLQNQGNQTDLQENLKQENKIPDYKPQVPGQQRDQFTQAGYQPDRQPGQTSFDQQHTTTQPGLPSFGLQQPWQQTGHPGSETDPLTSQPGQAGIQQTLPPQPGLPGSQPELPMNYPPGHPEYQPGQSPRPSYKPGQPSLTSHQPGQPSITSHEADQPGYQIGQGQPLLSGSQPGQIGQYPIQQQQPGVSPQKGGEVPGLTPYQQYQSMHPASDDQEFPPPPPPELLAFPSDLPSSDAASIDSGVELYDNIGAKLRSRLDEEGNLTPLQGMLANEKNISSIDAVQAPYGAQIDTLTGGMSMATGSDVNILFPGESQLIGKRPDKNSATRGHKSKYTCQGCSLPMNVGDVAIFCERAGDDKCWHPACFSCYTCKELLADLIYFYKDGKVFCGRHFTESEEMPRCKACDELIFGNSWTRADGFDWHINHFCCNVCDTPMAGQRYVPDSKGYPYCLPCYMSCLAKMCETCEEKISPEVNRCGHRGYFYHATPQCFRCYTCHDSLLGTRFKMSKNWVFCSNECIQKAAEDLESNPNPKMKEA